MPQSIDNTQASLALTQAFVMSGVFPPRDGGAGGAFLDEIFTFAFNFAPGSPNGTLSANGQLLSIAQHTAVFSLIVTNYGGNGTTNFALPDLGGITMIGTGQGPGLSPEQLGVRDGTSVIRVDGREQLADQRQRSDVPAPRLAAAGGITPHDQGSATVAEIAGVAGIFRDLPEAGQANVGCTRRRKPFRSGPQRRSAAESTARSVAWRNT
jgi:Phage Tail Collar Domain